MGIDADATVVALLPGSRIAEVERLDTDFIAAATWIGEHRPQMKFVAPMASQRVRGIFERQLAARAHAPLIRVIDGQAQAALAAANAAIVASGTATLETLLSKRPMVVAYRLGTITALLLERLALVKVPYFSQPNLLVGRKLVPEFFQQAVTGEALGTALLREMEEPARVAQLQSEFRRAHAALRLGGAQRAAAAILGCAGET